MTDRHAGYIVIIGDDIREDDAEDVINALRMVKGVIDVQPVQADHQGVVARERMRREFRDRIWEFYKSLDKPDLFALAESAEGPRR